MIYAKKATKIAKDYLMENTGYYIEVVTAKRDFEENWYITFDCKTNWLLFTTKKSKEVIVSKDGKILKVEGV